MGNRQLFSPKGNLSSRCVCSYRLKPDLHISLLAVADTASTGRDQASQRCSAFYGAVSCPWPMTPLLFMGAAALIGFPFALGIYKLWVSNPVSRDGKSIRNALALVVIAFIVAYPVCVLLGGESNATHVPGLMWSAFALPVGWAGLCKFLRGRSVESAYSCVDGFNTKRRNRKYVEGL